MNNKGLDNNYELVIIWARKEELNCKFQDLFKPIILNGKKVKVINLPYVGPGIVNKGHNTISEIIKNYYKKKSIVFFNQVKEQTNNKNIFISTYEEWYKNNNKYNMFFLKESIKKQVDKYLEKFSNNMVGVHIRRTDNTVSIANSPSGLYEKKIEEFLVEDSNRKFFVASDDEKEIINLREKYGEEKIITQANIDRRRNSREGIKSALVDLYLLANTEVIIGSYYSSFTDVAAAIDQRKLIIIGNHERE